QDRAIHRHPAKGHWSGTKLIATPMMKERSLQEILASYDEASPLQEASTIPGPWYTDPRIADLEAQTVFSNSWQLVARTDQVEKPGQFVTANIAGEPIVVVRGNDGVLRGFYNVW